MDEELLFEIWESHLYQVINQYLLILFHSKNTLPSITIDDDVLYTFSKNKKHPYVVFKLKDFTVQLLKHAKTIKSLKIPQTMKIGEWFNSQKNHKLFVSKINQIETQMRETFKLKNTFLGYRGDIDTTFHKKKEKNFIKETFTSISTSISVARQFTREQGCCFYFYFIDPNVKIIPIYKHSTEHAEILLTPSLYFKYISFGFFEIRKTTFLYYVYYIQNFQPNIPFYNTFTPSQINKQITELKHDIRGFNIIQEEFYLKNKIL
jgi:hypothetical protein